MRQGFFVVASFCNAGAQTPEYLPKHKAGDNQMKALLYAGIVWDIKAYIADAEAYSGSSVASFWLLLILHARNLARTRALRVYLCL